MQCKDIPDRPILEFLQLLAESKITSYYTVGQGLEAWQPTSGCVWNGAANSIQHAMPSGPGMGDKLAIAKMAMLIRRGLVDGCACGCRGDFRLTEKGLALLRGENATKDCAQVEMMDV